MENIFCVCIAFIVVTGLALNAANESMNLCLQSHINLYKTTVLGSLSLVYFFAPRCYCYYLLFIIL